MLEVALLVLLAGFLGAALIRWAPGTLLDEREMDPRLSEESRRAMRQERAAGRNILAYYAGYLRGLARGDLGRSLTLNRPVGELLRDRSWLTAESVAIGLAVGWALGVALASLATAAPIRGLDWMLGLGFGAVISLPSAVIAFGSLMLGAPLALALAVVVMPRVYRYARNLLAAAYQAPHVLAARARGIGEARILFRHCLPRAAAPLVALAGVSVSTALGAAIPMEAICDRPGVGQLVWIAASGRDLPVLVNLTLLVTAVTLGANRLAGWLGGRNELDKVSGPA